MLVPIAFAPDWIEWIADALGHHDRAISHSLVSVGIGASLTALIYWLTTRQRADAAIVWLTYVSHWPADFITGLKPTWPGGPMVGLLLYTHPVWDALLECALVVACWLAYRRTLAARTQRRAILLLIPLGLIGMQIAFEAVQYGRVEGRTAPAALNGMRWIGGRNNISLRAELRRQRVGRRRHREFQREFRLHAVSLQGGALSRWRARYRLIAPH